MRKIDSLFKSSMLCIRPVLQLIYFLLFTIIISCNSKPKEIQQLHFGKSYLIKGDTIQMEAANISSLLFANNYLIASQFSGDDFLKVYDARNFQELGILAKRGSGENEFPTMIMVDQFEQCGNHDCLWVHDLNRGELMRINLTESLKNQTTVINKKVMTRAESRFHTIFYIDSSRVVGRSTNSTPQMNRLQVYDPQSDLILKTIPLFPKIERTRNDLDFVTNKYNTIYVSNIGLKSDKTRIASAMCSFDRIDIFKTDGELEKSVFDGMEIPNNITEYLEGSDSYGLNIYYTGIFTTNDYIYALYYGQPFSEYGRTPIQPKSEFSIGMAMHSVRLI
jgi:hypothetical protein